MTQLTQLFEPIHIGKMEVKNRIVFPPIGTRFASVTGDVTQIDLPADRRSGLIEAIEVLRGVDGIGFMHFSDADVVRHPLVQSIIRAYERRGGGRRDVPHPDAGPAPEAEPESE